MSTVVVLRPPAAVATTVLMYAPGVAPPEPGGVAIYLPPLRLAPLREVDEEDEALALALALV